ncbi:MAG TPA: dihydrofolate reductase family protein [Actinomycetota bacterium]|nr:dihydrofolate reductase family protein [Actinomycetota bacterium]
MQTTLRTLFEVEGLPSAGLPDALRQRYGGELGFPPQIVYANFVTSLDGIAALDPETPPSVISAKSDTDRFVMGLLRAFADAVVVGAGTLRAEPRHLWTPERIYPSTSADYAELRASLGRQSEPQLVLLTRKGDVDPSLPAFEAGALIVTTDQAASRLRSSLPPASRAIGLPEAELSVSTVLHIVRAEGHQTILTEGGPTVLGGFLKERVLDELFLTLSPRIAGHKRGDERLSLVENFAYPASGLQPLSLLSAKQDGSHLFLRYRIDLRT